MNPQSHDDDPQTVATVNILKTGRNKLKHIREIFYFLMILLWMTIMAGLGQMVYMTNLKGM